MKADEPETMSEAMFALSIELHEIQRAILSDLDASWYGRPIAWLLRKRGWSK